MRGQSSGKYRILCIMRALEQQTSVTSGISMASIIEMLKEEGIRGERKAIYNDLQLLREFGLDIKKRHTRPVEYYLANRHFSTEELALVIDAVQSCKFITHEQAKNISNNLKLLAPVHDRDSLERNIHVDEVSFLQNSQVLQDISTIHEAMRARKRITFTYWKMGMDGEYHAQHAGHIYEATPMRVSFSDNFYYLTAWTELNGMSCAQDSQNRGAVREYRVDRMRDVHVSEEGARRYRALLDYEYKPRNSEYFGRFDGKLVYVGLSCDEQGVNIVADRFGSDATWTPSTERHANNCVGNDRIMAHAHVRVSPQFFGWIAGMDGKVKISSPKKLVLEYKEYIAKLLDE